MRHVIKHKNHIVNVIASLDVCNVKVFGNVLTEMECKDLVAVAQPRLTRSRVMLNTDPDPIRTSHGVFLDSSVPLVARLQDRFDAITGNAGSRKEDLQILRYRKGEEYKPHFDFFDTKTADGKETIKRHGQRFATLVVYLASPTNGGATILPNISNLSVYPHVGHAVYFEYNAKEKASLHGGVSILSGIKWAATQWWLI